MKGQKEGNEGLTSLLDTELFDVMWRMLVLGSRYRTFQYQSESSVEPSTGDIILGFIEGKPNIDIIGIVESKKDNYGYTDFEVHPFLAKGPIEDRLNPNGNGMIWLSNSEVHGILSKKG